MGVGTQQILRFAQEVTYGVAVVPSTPFAIVTGGKIQEGTQVHSFYGPESKQMNSQRYGAIDCGGSCNVIVTDLNLLSWASSRFTETSPLYSWTVDAGNCYITSAVKRMTGCKCNSLAMELNQDEPITAAVEWMGKEIALVSTLPGMAFVGNYWVMQGATLTLAGTPVANLQSFELRIENNLTRKYLANRQNTNLRALTRINEGNQKITVGIKAWDHYANPVRTNTPASNGIEIILSCYCPVTNVNLFIRLGNCYQESTEEVLEPIEIIEYGYGFVASSIAFL